MTLIAIIYLVGVVVAYVSGRYAIRKYQPPYTIKDRIDTMILSVLSWIACIIAIAFIYTSINKNKPAKW